MKSSKTLTVVSYLIWPTLIFGSLYVAHLGFEAGISPGLWAFVVTVGNLAIIAGLERVMPRKAENTLVLDRRAIHDLAHGGLYSTIGQPLGASIATLLVTLAYGDAGLSGAGLWPNHWPMVPQVILASLIFSLGEYWKHRAYHSVDSLWWIHAVHHDTPELHVLKAGRLHFLEAVLRTALVQLPLVILGAPGEVLLWMALWINFEGHLNHSNLAQKFPHWMHSVFQTIDIHEIHHSIERKQQDSNYSYPWLDRLFGTFNHPDLAGNVKVGLHGDQVPSTFIGQLVLPFSRGLNPILRKALRRSAS